MKLAVALTMAAAVTGTGTAYAADQTATDSVGTVQAGVPDADAAAAVAAPTTADDNDGVETAPTATVTAATAPTGGTQSADNSTGTAQVGGGGSQAAQDSVGTFQTQVPTSDATVSASAPSTADVNDGAASDPSVSVAADVSPGSAGTQAAEDSAGTAQIGGGGSQSASDSVGTVQAFQPGLNADSALTSPATADADEGVMLDPDAALAVGLVPAGGSQTADNSTGTVQVGGGPQSANDSTGTAEVAMPAVNGAGDASAPTTLDANDGLATDPHAAVSLGATPSGGNQTADTSTGTVQIGGGGSQSASNSVGTVQVGSFASAGASGATPTSGVLGVETSSPAATTTAATPTARTPPGRIARPLGVEDTPLRVTRLLGSLPFTGLALWLVALLGLAMAALGAGTQSSVRTIA